MKSLPDRSLLTYIYSLPLLVLITATWSSVWADTLECRPFHLVEFPDVGPEKYDKGLLWEISKEGLQPSFIFGTMHVDDEEIINLPEPVLSRLNQSSYFVMETVPSYEDSMRFSTEMFFMDGNRLDEIVSEDIFSKTVSILRAYNMAPDIVGLMKPWAAYVIMSYPAGMGEVLDLKLLNMARQNGAEVSGLESFS